ncbi:hypothetical protein ACQUSR_17800 [Streptomyces sp. P1-3]|uniref:hypothetical protein n=1 Tax=Streptomyces sp. P1-3 TaxID=3421658 RepID=UPI003D35ADA3
MVDLEERLREIARATEPSIRLAGPEAARARGHRRRARKRVTIAASAVFTATALTIGSWQLLPGDDASRTLPAGPAPSPTTTADTPATTAAVPSAALLPPAAMPFSAYAHWKSVRSTDGTDAPLLDVNKDCRLTGLDGNRTPVPRSQRARTYEGRKDDQKARHTINAYANERDAVTVYTALEETIRTRCGSPRGVGALDDKPSGSAKAPRITTYIWTPESAPEGMQVVLMRSGTRVAVVQAAGTPGFAEYTDGVATYCMSVSLWRSQPSAASSPPPYESNPEEAKRRC